MLEKLVTFMTQHARNNPLHYQLIIEIIKKTVLKNRDNWAFHNVLVPGQQHFNHLDQAKNMKVIINSVIVVMTQIKE